MQDIHSIGGGGGGRLFGGGDRRLRPHHQQNHQALKCPRCDSLNTKFCYYNNYNLSQPRHFCKSCRRYWTKGGVLRNVPVGGGCRKTKRSKPKSSPSDAPPRDRKSNSHSSSESSSLTATTTTATATTSVANTAAEVASASTSTSASALLNFPDSRFFVPQTSIPNLHTATASFDPPLVDQSPDGGIFSEIGSFTNLMTSSSDPSFLGLNMADISSYRLHQDSHGQFPQNQRSNQQWQQQGEEKISDTTTDDLKMEEITAGFLNQTAPIDAPPGLQRNGGLAAVDWHAGEHQGLFDLSGAVDQAYWSQTQWTDNNDHSLYLP